MSSQSYNVPVILPDLRKEESYSQIVDALEYLDAVANDIFNRISCRVAESRDQLSLINNRIYTAQAKIDKLRSTTTKATRVFSSPKYPAPETITDYHSLYQDVNPALHKARRRKIPIESRLQEVTVEILRSKTQPCIINLRKKRDQSRFALDDPEMGEGLGRLPRHLPSVSSLLLFNTDENPYKKYVVLDPLSGATTKTRDAVEEENKLSDAPVTITKGEELGRGQQDSIMYVPVMPELPELDVPEMLPQLQYVASDMFYTGDVGASIAPSLANTAVPDLPNLADPGAPAAVAPPPDNTGGTELPPVSAPPPPPPPPVQDAPPLPPIQEDSDEEGEGDGEDYDDDDEAGGGGDDDRSNLMAAIRNAGGASKAGLKSTKNRKRERKAKKEESVPESGGDLLSDLSAALGRRRKAMSGKEKGGGDSRRDDKKEDHSLGGGSMMDNISRMIPAPPPPAGGPVSDHDSLVESGEGGW